jgi:hypothetical protein
MILTGGCLCGALRYEARSPLWMGHCYCGDCRKASGSGFIPFIGFKAEDIRITGAAQQSSVKAANGNDAVRNHCARCASLVYGGTVGVDDTIGVYAGSLDDPSLFVPTSAIFTKGKPDWAVIPPGLKVFEGLPVQ